MWRILIRLHRTLTSTVFNIFRMNLNLVMEELEWFMPLYLTLTSTFLNTFLAGFEPPDYLTLQMLNGHTFQNTFPYLVKTLLSNRGFYRYKDR